MAVAEVYSEWTFKGVFGFGDAAWQSTENEF
jgi:hypothetical protein